LPRDKAQPALQFGPNGHHPFGIVIVDIAYAATTFAPKGRSISRAMRSTVP